MEGVEWTVQEATDILVPFIKATPSLTELIISSETLDNPEHMIKVMSTADNEKVIEALYSSRTELAFVGQAEWLQSSDN